ncbi:helicase-associated domain-containing protein [Ktedonospora formicarum]|uniref:Helicase XPB/Ssl2 N-terminal domain-containing protein n=1 Tax=Ktedonospora formicarum TaxID=2778364 RepID=A0A8J3MSL6_9CHLR|nr:helicase-associated domain-containing protein [Ktedonospora formicarum]GHO44743.1 hypothetical protein KSX_29060 [Ktedonospora formicarum]
MKQSDLDLLRTIPIYHLHTIARMRQVTLTGATPGINTNADASESAELDEIARQLFEPETLHTLLQNLSEHEQAIIQELLNCGGRANSRDLALYFNSAGLVPSREQGDEIELHLGEESRRGIIHYPPAHPHGLFEQALRALLTQGLLFWNKPGNLGERDYASGTYDGIVVVPPGVHAAGEMLWQTNNNPDASQLENENEATSYEISEQARRLQRRLYRYWSAVSEARDGLTILNNGFLSRSSWRLIMARIAEGVAEHGRPENEIPSLLFLRLLAQKLGILHAHDGVLQTGDADAYFALPLSERVKRCYNLALDGTFWNEIAHLPDINVRPGPGPMTKAQPEIVRSRHAVAELVAREKPGIWHSLSGTIARTRLYEPYLLFPRQQAGSHIDRYSSECNIYGWDFRLQRGWLTHREGWYMVEGGFVRTVITGLLNWLGVVELDINLDSEDPPTSFRLTPCGLALLKEYPLREEEQQGRLIVQPNFELVALEPVSEALLVALDRFAERVKLEYIAQYRLTRASVTQAIQRGLFVDAILRTLEQATHNELPQNVRYTLLEWERQARRIEIHRDTTLLEVEEPGILDALLADERGRNLFGQRLSPTLVIVAADRLPEAQELLWEKDYLPALSTTSTSQTEAEPQWRLREDGLLQPLYGVLNFYSVRLAERFCERDQDTGWLRLSEASLKQAREQGLALEEILRLLESHCIEGIPGSLLARLKIWGGGYEGQPTIRVEHAPLLAFSEPMLRDLAQDTEIQALLGPAIAAEQRLVHVEEKHLEHLLQLLRERGFEIE